MTTTTIPPLEVEATLVNIGDMAVSQSWVSTPAGACRVGQVTWTLTDLSRVERRIPGWAIVFAILLFPIGLLFLLAKQEETVGWVQVDAAGPRFAHSTMVAVASARERVDVYSKVAFARSTSAAELAAGG